MKKKNSTKKKTTKKTSNKKKKKLLKSTEKATKKKTKYGPTKKTKNIEDSEGDLADSLTGIGAGEGAGSASDLIDDAFNSSDLSEDDPDGSALGKKES